MQEKIFEQEEESIVSQILFKYLPYWPLFLLFMVLSVGAAWLYLRYTAPQYEATATIILKDEKKGADDSKILEQLNLINTKKIIENETEVLKSRTLMDNVVRDLRLYAPIYREGDVRSTSAYHHSPVVVEAIRPDSLQESKDISLQFDTPKNEVILDKRTSYPLNEWVKTEHGILRFLPNPKYAPADVEKPFFLTLVPVRSMSQQLLRSLGVTAASKLSSVINLSFQDDVPQRAEDILNSVLENYDRLAIEEKNNLAKNTLTFVEDRLGIVSKDLDSIERKVQNYKSRQGAIDISTQGSLFLRNVSENDQKLSEVNMKLAVLNQVEDFVKSKEKSGGIVPSTFGINDPQLSQLLDKLYSTELEHERLKKTVAENNPMLVSVTDQINKIRPSILENIQSQRQGLQASRNNINTTNSMYNSMLSTIPAKERQLLDISREQAIKSNLYSFLLQKREESALSTFSNVSDSRVVDKAQASPKPVSPNSKLIYFGSIILAMIVAIGVVTARDAFNGKILYRQDLEKLTRFPVIGEISYKKHSSPIVIGKGKRTIAAEEFRKIRMSLPFLGVGERSKKIMVTSSIPGEGKSFVSANLAMSLAMIGKKVVLIDMDLINPTLEDIFDCKEQPGVSNYLTGEKDAEEIIRQSRENEDLFFIPSGFLPDSPSELLSTGKVKDLLDYLEKMFDFIVIDTAPVVPVTDAYLITQYCNTTLFVVRHNHTPALFMKRFDENMKINELTNPAIIFNGVKSRGFFKNKYGYGYGYSYVYEYKPAKKEKKELKEA